MTACTTDCLAASVRRILINPGPAISNAAISELAGIASMMFCANSRGFLPKGLANCMAILHAASPCAACLGRSKTGVAVDSGATLFSAKIKLSVICVRMWLSIIKVQYGLSRSDIITATPKKPKNKHAFGTQIVDLSVYFAYQYNEISNEIIKTV